jgi:hypothetical protein
MSGKRRGSAGPYYDPGKLEDAPEHHDYSRAMGILTWGTWDHGVRSHAERIKDFVLAFPPEDPVRRLDGGDLEALADGSRAPGTPERRLQRFTQRDWRPGSLDELLARYGLRAPDAPALVQRPFVPEPLRQTTQRRNMKLRVLHGGVDIEAKNMDAAKADYLDRQEKRQAAADVREALKKMREDLKNGEPPEESDR